MNALWADRLIMALKTAIAVVISLYIAIRCDLVQPAWAILGVLLVTVQPMMFTGATPPVGVMVRRGIARLIGTVVGALAGVMLIAMFGQQPMLFVVAAGAWLAFCTYCVMLLQDEPLSYTMMLCGYTATMVSLSAIGHDPTQVINYAIGRTEETGLGIVVGLLVNIVFLPKFGSDRLPGAITAFLKDAALQTRDVLDGRVGNDSLERYRALLERQRQMDQTQGMARFEHWRYRVYRQPLARFSSESLTLLSSIRDLESALERLRRQPGGDAPADQLAERLVARLEAWQSLDENGRLDEAALERIEPPERSGLAPPTQACLTLALSRLEDILNRLRHGQKLLATLHTGKAPRELPRRVRGTYLHLEHGVARFNAFRVFAGFVALGLFWVHSGWHSGYFAMMMMAVFCVLFAKAPNPHKIVFQFLIGTALSVPVAMFYSFILFPALNGFWLMAISLAVPVGLTALMLPYPALAASLPAVINLSMTLNLKRELVIAPEPLMNSSMASIVGTAAAVVVFMLFRQRPAAARLEDLFNGFWEEIARLGNPRDALPNLGRLEIRLHDRLGRMLALGDSEHRLRFATLLHGLGLGVWRLRRRRRALGERDARLEAFDAWLKRLTEELNDAEDLQGIDVARARKGATEAIDWARHFYHERVSGIEVAAELEMLSHLLSELGTRAPDDTHGGLAHAH
ncbi:FUSC family protein [Larsenimonas suaedae]|uniref:FUSC family protein n=1 Tax=Larsenimonas suaedae TaxID=1851019 RepID=A0ABU1GTN4_9GAMM|nr:FUSC family protein [Larsenimonas suaedae]MCM2972352.1 FUSC family protein [Larsenimonas suaedae]MDR5894852.1 FUSC family protein [Larsenimonas suaedae]